MKQLMCTCLIFNKQHWNNKNGQPRLQDYSAAIGTPLDFPVVLSSIVKFVLSTWVEINSELVRIRRRWVRRCSYLLGSRGRRKWGLGREQVRCECVLARSQCVHHACVRTGDLAGERESARADIRSGMCVRVECWVWCVRVQWHAPNCRRGRRQRDPWRGMKSFQTCIVRYRWSW
jgi:hypothetical protein